MPDARLTIKFAGPHVSIQDCGRSGKMRFGVPRSGPMDRASAAIANTALGNPLDAPLIEISMGGLMLFCEEGSVSVAVAGGGFIVEIGERKFGSWTIFNLQKGEKLSIRPGPWGSWTYLAFAGDLQATAWMGSKATHALSGFGGGKLSTGQNLIVKETRQRHTTPKVIACPVWARPKHSVNAVLGPQDRHFTPEAINHFRNSSFYMTNAFDRMGMRLHGPKLPLDGALSIPSEPIVRGSVQVSGDGTATVLMADHQTTGGYPKIATVLDCDTDAFAQLRPRDAIRFTTIDSEEALARARLFHTQLNCFLRTLTAA